MTENPAQPPPPEPPGSKPADRSAAGGCGAAPRAAAHSGKWPGCFFVALALLVLFVPQVMAQAPRAPAIGTRLEQCANRLNGTTAPINDCTGSAWVRGDLNRNNSVYREGDFVPFRTTIDSLVAGRTYTLGIGYDAIEKGLHAYDYLGSFDASAAPGQQIVPCDGIAGTAGAHSCQAARSRHRAGGRRRVGSNNASTLAVPEDVDTHFPGGAGRGSGPFPAGGRK